jgi:hypothetical protein
LAEFRSRSERLLDRDDSELCALRVDHPNLPGPNILVDVRPVSSNW